MGKKVGLILMFFFVFSLVKSQENELSYKTIDSLTYDLFLKQDWKSLIEIGKESKKNNIDFYYLNVRMGIAYFKIGEMISSVKLLEEAYNSNNFDIVVQDYLYWAYRYAGFYLESDVFYENLDKVLQDQIKLKLPFISAVDVGVVATSNSDYTKLIASNESLENDSYRDFPENQQINTIGLNHRFSNNSNFYHRLTFMPRNLVTQEKALDETINTSYKANEYRYFANATFTLGKRWYLDAYSVLLFGNYDDITQETDEKIKYSDVVFGGAISKSSFFIRNSLNISFSNLNGLNQIQTGYSFSIYPLGNTFLVPFGSLQFINETLDSNTESRIVFSGGFTVNSNKFSITGYANIGEIKNYIANNGAIIYNQIAESESEIGAIARVFFKNMEFNLGYSVMKMKDYSYSLTEVQNLFTYNQQNLIVGITWRH